jgi:hypothetical protein
VGTPFPLDASPFKGQRFQPTHFFQRQRFEEPIELEPSEFSRADSPVPEKLGSGFT